MYTGNFMLSIKHSLGVLVSVALLSSCSREPIGDLGVEGCNDTDPPIVAPFWAGDGVTDVTFMAVGDSQIFLDASLDAVDDSYDTAVAAINAFDGFTWNSLGSDDAIDRVRGLIMAGDITQNGRDGRDGYSSELGVFAREYGLCGNRHLIYPVYEGYGNHDYREFPNLLYPNGAHPVADSVSIRNDFRAGLDNKAPGIQGHYTWVWDDVHFINVNLTVSDTPPDYEGELLDLHDPRMALTYLRQELERIGPDAPVVITHHYPPTSGLNAQSRPDVQGYQEAIAGFNVVAIIHGHIHSIGSISSFNGVPTFHAGYARRHFELSEGAPRRGTFRVMRITNDKLYTLGIAWTEVNPGQFEYNELPFSSTVVDL